ncbi:hypothetical protein F0562_010087 [Nyssa sinensis]|uniref:GDSL esterase/lipase At5g55050-like n=1 Tax=Nyssa sinensis TaxID=561372 RepID=A0A5J5A0I0_9ASTE|nr:hypothetical protein F0562_010087 [Nyssa sinensis]
MVSSVIFSFFFFSVFTFFCEAQKAPAIFVFGDSLVDVGNNNYLKLSIVKANFPPNGVDFPGKKPTGRFSNGKNPADFLAEKVGLPSPPPYLSISKSNKSMEFLTGVSFASGGAGIFTGTDELYDQAIPLAKQVDYYLAVYEDIVQQLGSAGAQDHLSKSLFAIVIGSNDLLAYIRSRKKTNPQQYVDQMVLNFKGLLKRMHDLGARKFVITGIGALGCTPRQRNHNKTGECNEQENRWSLMYNQGLKSMLQGLKSELKDINYSYFDTYRALLNFIQKPAIYGFSEVKAACCGLGNLKAQAPCVPISTYCNNRSDHLFWDIYHPTEAASRIFADIIFYGPQQYAFPMNLKQLIDA